MKFIIASSSSCVTVHIKQPVAHDETSRALCPGGRFPPSFIHQVIGITGLNRFDNSTMALIQVGGKSSVYPHDNIHEINT